MRQLLEQLSKSYCGRIGFVAQRRAAFGLRRLIGVLVPRAKAALKPPYSKRFALRRLVGESSLISLVLLGSLWPAVAGDAAAGRVVKVLPFFLDLKGQNALSPSLYDRDAYQAYLLRRPEQRSAIRFDVLWKASNVGGTNLKLRVELRGIGEGGMPRQSTLEQTVTPHFFRHWNSLTLGGQDYKSFGELVAWRVTLWSGSQMLSEQKSFLW